MARAKTVQKIHIDKLQATLTKLEQLEKKQQEELTLRESIHFLRDKLRSALKKGYSYQDLSEILEQQGILVSAATLKQYLTEINNSAAKSKRSTSSGQPSLTQSKRAESTAAERAERLSAESEEKKEASASKSESESSQEVNEASNTENFKPSEVSLSEDNKQKSGGYRQQDTRKTGKAKPKKLASSNTDLSSEFNQY